MCNTSFSVHFFHLTIIGKLFIKKNRSSPSLNLFFLHIYNPMSISLKSLVIFLNSRSKVNFKAKEDFSTNEARNKYNTAMSCDLDWAIHFLNYFNYLRSSSRSTGQFQGNFKDKISILTSKARNACNNTSFSWDFDRKNIFNIISVILGPLQGHWLNML